VRTYHCESQSLQTVKGNPHTRHKQKKDMAAITLPSSVLPALFVAYGAEAGFMVTRTNGDIQRMAILDGDDTVEIKNGNAYVTMSDMNEVLTKPVKLGVAFAQNNDGVSTILAGSRLQGGNLAAPRFCQEAWDEAVAVFVVHAAAEAADEEDIYVHNDEEEEAAAAAAEDAAAEEEAADATTADAEASDNERDDAADAEMVV
jgi:hypothetical protein